MKRLLSIILTALLICSFAQSAFAATVGQQLTAPEAGWQRYNDDNPFITYTGSWVVQNISNTYQGQEHTTIYNASEAEGSYVSFDFFGSKMRLIGQYWTTDSNNISVYIDGQLVSTISQIDGSTTTTQILNYEITNLSNTKHSVKMVNNTSAYLVVDAIDIDDSGYLVDTSLSAPLNLTATPGDKNVSLSWSSVTNATGYNVSRSTTAGGPYTQIASNVTGTSYSDATVTNGTTYYYVVTAIDAGGESGNSNEASATPLPNVPGAPINLKATAGDAQVGLTWTVSTGATSYNVKRATTVGGTYLTIATGITATSYNDTTVTNGTTYYYVVTAINTSGESGNSNEATATPLPNVPSAPIDLSAAAGDAQVGLTWTASTGANRYNVYRGNTSGGPYTQIVSSVTDTTYADTSVTNGTTYYYVITAVNLGGESGNSNEASATPQVAHRVILTITLENGAEREYDLSMADFNAFTTWYDAKANGTGSARYTFDDPHSKGPFVSRKNSVIFDKILTFDFDEYVPTN